jgi:tetratricopeptide (TPR) repeat protein
MLGRELSNPTWLRISERLIFPYHPQVNRLNSLFVPNCVICRGLVLLLLFLKGFASFAQTSPTGSQGLLHGAIFTAQGQPAVDATVEIWDLRGIKVASSITDTAGRFEIRGAAQRGQYIFLAAKAFQISEEQILLDPPDLELGLALPATLEIATPKPPGQTVSVGELGIPAKVRDRLSLAHKDFSRRNVKGALREVDAALRIDPHCAPVFSMRAFIKLADGDLAGAIEDGQRAVSFDTNDAESYVALGMAYNSLNEFPDAEQALRKALSLSPDSWQAQLEMAKSLYGQERFVLALRELGATGMDFPDVHLVRGDVLMRLGRRQEATEQFLAFLQEAPGDPRREQIQRIIAAARR